MRLGDLLQPSNVRCGLDVTGRAELIRAVLDPLISKIDPGAAHEILEAALARDKLGTLSVGRGVAFPHARSERISDFTVLAATLTKGIDFGASDGKPVQVVVFFVVGRSQSPLYLQALAAWSSLLGNPAHFEALHKAATPEEFVEYVMTAGPRLRVQWALADFVHPPVCHVTQGQTLRQAAEMLTSFHLSSVPVIGEDGGFLGSIAHTDLVRHALKHYILSIGHVPALSAPDVFNDFMALHGDTPIREAMPPMASQIVLRDDETLLEACSLLAQAGQNRAFVVKGGPAPNPPGARKLVGVFEVNELIKRLLKMRGR